MKVINKALLGIFLLVGAKASSMEQQVVSYCHPLQAATLSGIPDDVKKLMCSKLANLKDVSSLRRLFQVNRKFRNLFNDPRFLAYVLQLLQNELQLAERPMKNQYKISLDDAVCQRINPLIFRVNAAAQLRITPALNWLKNAIDTDADMNMASRLFFYTAGRRTHPLVKQVQLNQEQKNQEITILDAYLKEKNAMIHFMLEAGMSPNMQFRGLDIPIVMDSFLKEYCRIYNKYGISRPHIFQKFLKYKANINYKNIEDITVLDAFYQDDAPELNREHFIEFLKMNGAKRVSELPHS